MRSIRRYLLGSLLAALALGTLVIAVFLYIESAEEINELYDSNMRELATVIGAQHGVFHLPDHPIPNTGDNALHDEIREEEEFLIQIWNSVGDAVYTSHPLIAFPRQGENGFFTTRYQQEEWRVYSLQTGAGLVQVSQPQAARHIYIRELASNLLYALMLQIPVIGGLIWFAVGKSLQPLDKVSHAIQMRSAASLEHLDTQSLPIEIRPAIEELNHLLTRLGDAITSQQHFTADAAHELRTPLTALQLQLDILARSQSDQEREQALGGLQSGITRASKLVVQLLTLTRLGFEPNRQYRVIDLERVIRLTIEDHIGQAAAKKIDIGFSASQPLLVNGDEENLRIMTGNLLDNAIRYSPPHGRVDVLAWLDSLFVVLEVRDSASLIGGVERERVFERFYRGSTSRNTAGNGLGLAIVSDIVQQHHGQVGLRTRSDGAGNSFIVYLPRPSLDNDTPEPSQQAFNRPQ